MDLLDKFISILSVWIFISFLLALIGGGFLFYARYLEPEEPKRWYNWGGFLFAQVFLSAGVMLLCTTLLTGKARKEVVSFLNISELNIEVNRDNVEDNMRLKLLAEIKGVRPISAHHSAPTGNIRALLTLTSGNESYQLELKQDSEIGNEFWVFWNKYFYTETNEIGRIRSDSLLFLLSQDL